MSCKDTAELLSQYIDDELPLPVRAAVDGHLSKCLECSHEISQLRAISRSLWQLARPVPPTDLITTINDSLMIEAAAVRLTPELSLRERVAQWLEPRLMPYGIGSFASVVLFIAMFTALTPHFIALQQAARQSNSLFAKQTGYDLNQPVTPEGFSADRAPYAALSPSLDPGGALAALTKSYANPRADITEDADDMVVVADVFSNGAASLAHVVQAPRDHQMLADFEVALRQSAAFVPASLDRRPDTMRVVFTVQKVDVRDRSF